MVTYDGLIQFGILIVAIVSLVYKISHKKITALAQQTKRLFFNCFEGNRLSAAPFVYT